MMICGNRLRRKRGFSLKHVVKGLYVSNADLRSLFVTGTGVMPVCTPATRA